MTTPEEVLVQLKRKGTFDEIRRGLLEDFRNSTEGLAFIARITSRMEELTEKDPLLLDKEKSVFFSTIMQHLEKNGTYDTLKKEMLKMVDMKGDNYNARIDSEIRSIIDATKNTSEAVTPASSKSATASTATITIPSSASTSSQLKSDVKSKPTPTSQSKASASVLDDILGMR